ncbi:MAG TPA: flagellar basal body P-ring formation chaperone FlgA [bacterium]|nr:flagellar basal body P-ring formation chaperone FlgA [bacterium]HQO35951.1 flagellar basal body P-ring formation chaperone FlgA [bacterium]HQP97871.1 flagellar basal body P-ring formation chaperone FlgA [bacterium]
MRGPNDWQQTQLERIAITFLVSGLLILRATGVWALDQPEQIVIGLPASYIVEQASAQTVSVGDLAQSITGGTEEERSALRSVPVAPVPDPGEYLVCTSSRIIAAARQNGFDQFRRVSFDGPRNFKIFGIGQTVSADTLAERITQEIIQELDWDPKELTVRVLSFPNDLRLPPGDVRIQTYRTSPQRYGIVQYDLTILLNDEEYMHRTLIVEIAHRRDVYVFRNNKSAGSMVTLQDVDVQTRYIRSEREDEYTIRDPRELVGRKLARTVNRGITVTRDLFARAYLIPRGQVVSMVVRNGNLRMDIRGKTEQNGNIGDVIRVRNLFDNKTVQAKVVDANTVEMI